MAYDEIPRCRKCSYDLSGSPLIGRCPECGNVYNQNTLEGMKRPLTAIERGDLIVHWAVVGGLLALAVMIAICSGGIALAAKDPKRAIMIGGVLALIPIVAAVAKWLAYRLDQRNKN